MERIENRIYSRGLFSEAEQRQVEQQLFAIAEDPAAGAAPMIRISVGIPIRYSQAVFSSLSNNPVRQSILSRIVDTLCSSALVEGARNPKAPSRIRVPLKPITKR